MASPTLVVSYATAGDQSGYGDAHVENTAATIAPDGLLAGRHATHLIYEPTEYRGPVEFDLVSSFHLGLTRLDFGDPRPITSAGGLDTLYGTPTVENAAQAIYPPSIFDPAPPLPIVGEPPLATNFDLTDALESGLALQLSLGAGPQVLVVEGFDSYARTSDAFVENAADSVIPEPWVSLSMGFQHRVSADALGRNVEFDLTNPLESGLALYFPFGTGPHHLTVVGGHDSATAGVAAIENVAQGIFAEGFDAFWTFGPRVHRGELAADLTMVLSGLLIGTAENIAFAFGLARETLPTGWHSFEGGDLRTTMLVYPQGLDSLWIGEVGAAIFGQIAPRGVDMLGVGTPSLPALVMRGLESFSSDTFEVIGIDPPAAQDAEYDGWHSLIFGFDDEAGSVDDRGFVSHFVRRLFEVGEILDDQYGQDHFVAFRVRYLEVSHQNYMTEWGLNVQVGYRQDIQVEMPYPMTEWGDTDIDIVRLEPPSIDSLLFGMPWFSFRTRYLFPFKIPVPERGEPGIYNVLQFIEPAQDCTDSDSWCGARYGRATVINFNKTIRPAGLFSERFASSPAVVASSGRGYEVPGLDATQWGDAYVGNYEMFLAPWGWDSFTMVSYHMAFNNARLLEDPGLDATQWGDASVAKAQYKTIGGYTLTEWGVAWVSRSPREIVVYTSRPHLVVPHIRVGFTPLVVEAEGWSSLRMGGIDVEGKPIPTILPRWPQTWQLNEWYMGIPERVWNVTPELDMTGRNHFRSDRQRISFLNRTLEVEGLLSLTFGSQTRPVYRDRELPMEGINFLRISTLLEVWNVDPDPPSDRIVAPVGFCMKDHSNAACGQYGRPSVRSMSIWQQSPDPMLKMGIPQDVVSNGILFDLNQDPHGHADYGSPIVSGGVKWVDFSDDDNTPAPHTLYGKPRMSPHTIWARKDTPDQAKRNNPGLPFHEVDYYYQGNGDLGPWFGRPSCYGGDNPYGIWHNNNSWPYYGDYLRVPEPKVENEIRKLYPESWHSLLLGYPTLATPFTQEIEPWMGTSPWAQFGEPSLRDTGPQYLTVGGLGSLAMGAFNAENLNRFVPMTGLDATQYGGNTPMVYHYPRGFTVTDNDLTQFGATWVSHSPRFLGPEGFDSFEGTDWTKHATRMTIENYLTFIRGYAYSILTEYGEPTVEQTAARLTPYGIGSPCVSPQMEVEHA